MKRIILFLICLLTLGPMLVPVVHDERKQVYLMAGTGYAFDRFGNISGEFGAEVRLFGGVHARLLLDYDSGNGVQKNGEVIENAFGVNLYALYKVYHSNIMSFNIKAGGNYTTIHSQITAFGVTFPATESSLGVGGGAGLEWQFSNRLEVYLGVVAKYLFTEEPLFWLKMQMGLRLRLR